MKVPLTWLLACALVYFSCLACCEGTRAACMFTKSDLPVPGNSLIVGDPRKKEECRRTSFEATRPANLFDPAGVRMWTREEDTTARNTDSCSRYIIEKGMERDTYTYLTLNLLARSKVKVNGSKFVFQMPRNLKAGSSTLMNVFNAGGYVCV